MFVEDTISAVATALGEGGIGIVRMSGPKAVDIANQLFTGIQGKKAVEIKSQQVAYGHIVDPESGRRVDEGLLLIMRGPKSYTMEDVVEIHCHGGVVPLKQILELTLRFGARLAEPGEFTKRAFLNGRLDLAQAEAVMDIITAKTELSMKSAMMQRNGALIILWKDIEVYIIQSIK